MATLELLVPPPVVALITGAVMWSASSFVPSLEVPSVVRVASAITIAVIGLGFDIAGIISFLRARTTVNPMKPATTSSLVSSGAYRITRNPMYLGMLFILIAWAVFLSSVWLLLGPLIFVLYMNRFQIGPEEKALLAMFGNSYAEYKARARRWL
jgi:protein-S-isoprenylcysteine O-methyltransferase Ste14